MCGSKSILRTNLFVNSFVEDFLIQGQYVGEGEIREATYQKVKERVRREQQAAEEDVLERPREAQGSSQLRALVDVDSVFVELICGFHTLGGK